MNKSIENISDGIKKRSSADSFVGANTIHKAKHAHTKVLNIKGTIIDSPGFPGIRNIKRVIPK